MGTPAGHTGNRKQRGVQVLADAEHTVDQAAEQVHVGADLLRAVLFLGKDLRGQALNAAQQLVLLVVALLVGQALGVGLQNLRTGVAHRVDGVAHAVDQAAAVAALLAEDLAQELADLVVVGRILDIFQNVIQLVHDLQVRAAVLGALQRADGRADGRIGVRAGAGQHAAGEGRAVAAAVVRVDEQAEVEQTRFLVGELLVGAVGAQNMLRRALALGGQVEVHAGPVIDAALDLVGVDHHRGQLGDQVDALAQDVGQAVVLGVLVVAVHGQHASRHLVHQVRRRRVQDHVVGKALRQLAVVLQQLAELSVLLLRGQGAEQQQPDDLLKHEAVMGVGLGGQRVNVDAAVDQTARNGHDGAVLLLVIADNAGHVRDAGQHTGAVQIAQTALDAHLVCQMRVKGGVMFQIFVAEQLKLIRLQGRDVRVIHRAYPSL